MIGFLLTVGGCAVLFLGIGLYARRLKKPMWFWSGTAVDPDTITDIPAYNRANGRMWMTYSLWYWGSCLAYAFSPIAAVVLLMVGSTLGTIFLMFAYRRIENRYRK